ncbi:MAG: hypothetical protein L6R00_09360 [Phycisphaerae bacterium]|nr:hypothetical protein [Phycisphaerae bacterium]
MTPAVRRPIPSPALLRTLEENVRRIEGGFGRRDQRRHLPTGLAALDAALPGGGLAAGAIHELLSETDGAGSWTWALWLAARAAEGGLPAHAGRGASSAPSRRERSPPGGYLVWLDGPREFYPPAAAAWGIDPARLVIVRPADAREAYWIIDQTLRCPAVAAVIAAPPPMQRAEARRLQLAAEAGGGVGLLLHARPGQAGDSGAVSRWRIAPAPSAATETRRFRVTVERCRGGAAPPPVLIEVDHVAGLVAVSAVLADRTEPAAAADVFAA